MHLLFLVVEQNAKQALEISNLGFVLQNGKNKYSDTGKTAGEPEHGVSQSIFCLKLQCHSKKTIPNKNF